MRSQVLRSWWNFCRTTWHIVERYSADYCCRRFRSTWTSRLCCIATASDIASHEVRSGTFSLRTKETHKTHAREALDSGSSCVRVKRECPFTKALSHFHVATGYPPDIAHNLFEGIVPVEIAYCLTLLISKKYITLDDINNSIQHFPYQWTDKTNKPHILPQNLSSRKTIGGNAHENWNLLIFIASISNWS